MASSVATPLEREFSTIAGIQSMSSTNSQGSTSITIQFALDRNIDAAAQDVQAAISRRRRTPAAQHAAAALVSRRSTRPSSRIFTWRSIPPRCRLYTVERICRDAARAAHFDGQRRLARAGVRRAEVRRARAGGSRRAGGARHRHRRSAARHLSRATRTCRPARLDGDKQAFTIQSSGHVDERGGVPPDHRRVAQRHRRSGWKNSATSSMASRTTRWSPGTTTRAA